MLALLFGGSTAHAQDCLDTYLANSNTDFIQDIPSGVIWSNDASSGDIYQTVSGGGLALEGHLGQLANEAYGGNALPWIIRIQPLLPNESAYAPISVDMGDFPEGLTIYSQDGPDTVRIDGAGAAPAIEIFGSTSNLRIGYALGPTQDDWHGFEITGGNSSTSGGGIRVMGQTGILEISGNNIHDNASVQSAGGVLLDECSAALLGVNRIANNTTGYRFPVFPGPFVFGYEPDLPIRGAGVYQNLGQAEYVGNTFANNTFAMETFDDDLIVEPARQGGGLAVNETGGFGTSTAQVCANRFQGNNASEGGGFWGDIDAQNRSRQIHLEFNHVLQNTSWIPQNDPESQNQEIGGAYRGGGVFIRGDSSDDGFGSSYEEVWEKDEFGAPYLALICYPGELISYYEGGWLMFFISGQVPGVNTAYVPFLGSSLSVTVFNNRIQDNSVENPGFVTDSFTTDNVGGGMYTEVARNDDTDRVTLIGNALWANTSGGDGAGMFVDHQVFNGADQTGEIHHNTSIRNDVTDSGFGGGIGMSPLTEFDGSSNVFFYNTLNQIAGLSGGDWHAPLSVEGVFRYSQMPVYLGAGKNLFGTACNSADPMVVAGDWHLEGTNSPCIDSADPSLDLILSLLNVNKDADNGDRAVDQLQMGALRDRGGDEYLVFRRGDANNDGCVDLADAVHTLAYLFNSGPEAVCPDAADTNDDGAVDISDAVFLLDVLFPGPSGAPVSDVYCCFTADPTADSLPTNGGTSCLTTCNQGTCP